MPMRSLVTLDETLTAALTSGHLVVPNHRLQRAYTTAFDRHQQSLARHAWHTARVATLERHLIDAFHDAVDTGHAPVRSLLQPEAERWLWRETAPTAVTSNIDGLVDLAVDAWRLVHGWHLEEHLASAARNDAHALFANWSKRFAAALSDHESISSAELPTHLASLASNGGDWLPKHLVTAGFEVVAPAVVDLWHAYRRSGAHVHHHLFVDRQPYPSVDAMVFEDPDAEIRAAIAWARTTMERAIASDAVADVRIGIAVADIERQHAALTRALDATFTPTHPRTLPGCSAYNISAGARLAESAIARNAIDLIELTCAPIHHRQLNRLIQSADAGIIAGVRDAVHPGLPERFDLATWARMTASQEVSRLHELSGRWPRRAAPAQWAALFRDYLIESAWANNVAGDEIGAQARDATLDALDSLTQLAPLDLQWSAHEAATQFRVHCERTWFAPRRPDAVVQVLGFLETAGLEFTHLWVIGLDGNTWPGLPNPNPLLPIALQRRALVPRCTVEAEGEYTRAATARWRRSVTHLRFSCATSHADETRIPSPLIADWRVAISPTNTRHPFARPHATPITLVPFDDTPAPADPSTLPRRGSDLLRDHFACPFQAFTRHRLLIDEPRAPHSFPDAVDRGVLLHALFERIGRERIGARFEVDDATSVLDEILTNWRRFPSLVRVLERKRLARLLDGWLEIERSRPSYRIEAVEQQHHLTLDGLVLDLRIDRVDRASDGSIVIDYKSGRVGRVPIDASQPQLLLYALALPDCIGVFYAEINVDRVALRGIAADHYDTGTDAHTAIGRGGQSWRALQHQWREQLERAAEQFLAGEARVAPRAKDVCRACRFASLCRIESWSIVDD